MEEKKSDSEIIKIPLKWIISGIGLIAVIFIVFFFMNSGFVGGATVSEQEATESLLNFFAVQVPESTVTFVSSSKQGTLYEIVLNIDGEETPVFVTTDGEFLIIDMIPLK